MGMKCWVALISPRSPPIPVGTGRIWKHTTHFGGWTSASWCEFWHPWKHCPGLRWGIVVAWASLPRNWFDKT